MKASETVPEGWQNPVTVQPGQTQTILARLLLPSRRDLVLTRLEFQRTLRDSGVARFSLIEVTTEGVIWDGHHAARAFAEKDLAVEVRVVEQVIKPSGPSILDLNVR